MTTVVNYIAAGIGYLAILFALVVFAILAWHFCFPWWLKNGFRGFWCRLAHGKYHRAMKENGISCWDTPTVSYYVECSRCLKKWERR